MTSTQPAPDRQVPPVEDRWLTVDEVATYTQYSRRTIERALAAGDLRSARPVQDHRIRQSWVDAWMESAA